MILNAYFIRKLGDFMNIIKKIGKFFLIFFLIFVAGHIGFYVYCLITPKVEINKSQSYYLYDENDEEFLNRGKDWINLDDISDYVIKATLSTEDKYFYNHFGFDYIRIAKAVMTNIINRDMKEGASTVTQQYARNLFLNFDKGLVMKVVTGEKPDIKPVGKDKDDPDGYVRSEKNGIVVDNFSFFI